MLGLKDLYKIDTESCDGHKIQNKLKSIDRIVLG